MFPVRYGGEEGLVVSALIVLGLISYQTLQKEVHLDFVTWLEPAEVQFHCAQPKQLVRVEDQVKAIIVVAECHVLLPRN